MKVSAITIIILLSNLYNICGQQLSGTITHNNEPVPFANIVLKDTRIGTSTNSEGKFLLTDIPPGVYVLQVSALGFVPASDTVTITEGQNIVKNLSLQSDVLKLSQAVVTGTRNQVAQYNSPVIVNTVDSRIFEATQAYSIAEGLNFSPGLRVENNCQNCGFTQLRMNGLEGSYSQILINSRPVFSALAGVYGLEMLPATMVDRIEVVRGGGSVMYGGNAIAGTVNIITKDPIKNSFEVGLSQSFINAEASDRTVNFNGSLVSEDLNKGLTFFGFNRTRDHWDANGDGFSEIVELQNNTFGIDGFYNISPQSKLKLGAYYTNEYRRGGNKFELFPHQTDVTEQLQHNIVNANASYEYLSKNEQHKFSVYTSVQHVDRASYYGGGGRVIAPGDTLTPDDILAINAYGNSTDLSGVGGLQYNVQLNKVLSITTGTEYIYTDVQDEMPGYGRVIDQQVGTWGTYAELGIQPINRLTFLLGGRFDHLSINGQYDLESEQLDNQESLSVWVPRVSVMYAITENLKLRTSFAQGYRGPQAFDEDLHIETVGGAARFIRINPDLEVERSNSALLSLNYDRYIGRVQMNLVAEGFYTRLQNPFIFVDQTELPSGVAVINKINGSGATVAGVNLEANFAIGSKLVLQSGATFQIGQYDETEELWASGDVDGEVTTTDRLLRTPNAYGYFSLVYNPIKALALSYSGTLTGTMDVPHVVDTDTERTIIEATPIFFQNNLKVAYTFQSAKRFRLQLFGGVQNIFNSFQQDFDRGADRDAGYIYGPLQPRTYFAGLKFGLN